MFTELGLAETVSEPEPVRDERTGIKPIGLILVPKITRTDIHKLDKRILSNISTQRRINIKDMTRKEIQTALFTSLEEEE